MFGFVMYGVHEVSRPWSQLLVLLLKLGDKGLVKVGDTCWSGMVVLVNGWLGYVERR